MNSPFFLTQGSSSERAIILVDFLDPVTATSHQSLLDLTLVFNLQFSFVGVSFTPGHLCVSIGKGRYEGSDAGSDILARYLEAVSTPYSRVLVFVRMRSPFLYGRPHHTCPYFNFFLF